MEILIQEVENRAVLGKKVGALRRSGITPANVYGSGVDSVAIQVNTADLEKLISRAGGTRMITLKIPSFKRDRSVLVKGVQRNSITGKLLHVDFYQVSMKDKLKVEIPLVFQGDAPASRRKDLVMLEVLGSVEVECLPVDIPENIAIDMDQLAEAGDHLLVGDLSVSDKVSILNSLDDVIYKVEYTKTAEAEEAVEEEVEGVAAEAGEAAPAAEPEAAE